MYLGVFDYFNLLIEPIKTGMSVFIKMVHRGILSIVSCFKIAATFQRLTLTLNLAFECVRAATA